MPVVKVYSQNKDEVSTVELADAIFGVEPKEHLFHLMVRYQLAKRRAGTHAQPSDRPPIDAQPDIAGPSIRQECLFCENHLTAFPRFMYRHI